MEKQYVLYNPKANNGRGEAQARVLEGMISDSDLIFCDITSIGSYSEFFSKLSNTEKIIICGGDGTLNRFINDTVGLKLSNPIYYYPAGNGNDFANDLGKTASNMPFCIDEYLKDLPTVYVNGTEKLFLNGVGYGIDGYCCEVGDELKAKSDKPVNYSGIAIKGLLFHFKKRNATVTVDGVTEEYKGVWIAPTMNGRFYGGGMMPTPKQDRKNSERNLSLMLFHRSGKLKTLMIFPSLFKGEHVKHEKYIRIIEGQDISVKFDRPTALQIDGETVLGVTEYRAVSSNVISKKQISTEEAVEV